MIRTEENLVRVTYVISEKEVRKLVNRHANELGHPSPPQHSEMERTDEGGYRIVTEYIESVEEVPTCDK